ncbi:MAG: hypothetical protein HY650_11860 [Acidobacteria bacterium]|nr:hypothetical protein [Acidobacteriota bacterium]
MYQVDVWLHVLMASVWVGGLLYTGMIVVPFTAGFAPEERRQIMRGLARRFRWIGWGALTLAVLTGIAGLALRLSTVRMGQLLNGEAFDPDKMNASVVAWLPWKLFLVASMVLLMLLHDVLSLRAAQSLQVSCGSDPRSRIGTIAASMATLVALAVLYVSVRLAHG